MATDGRASGAVFPGSFDPLTNGHIDIVRRALNLFERVTIAVLGNPKKTAVIPLEERVLLIAEACKEFGDRVSVEGFSGLLVEFAKRRGTRFVIRGLRAITDYDYEAQMALMNRHLANDVETIFLMSREEYSYVSSTLVREVALLGGSVTQLVPPCIEHALNEKIRNLKKNT